ADGGLTWPGASCQLPLGTRAAVLQHGEFPSLAYDAESRPLIAFHVCGAGSTCTDPHLHLAWRELDGTTWKDEVVHSVASTTSGVYASLVVDPDTHEVAIAFQEIGSGTGAAMVA